MFLLIRYVLTPNINTTFKIIYEFSCTAPCTGHPWLAAAPGWGQSAPEKGQQLEMQRGTKAAALLTTEHVPQVSDHAGPFSVAVALGHWLQPVAWWCSSSVRRQHWVKIAQKHSTCAIEKYTTLGKTFLFLADKGILMSCQLTLALRW